MPVTPVNNIAFALNIATSILDGAADALRCNGLDVPARQYVGFNRPPQDCCPELTAWTHNIRTWDGEFPDTSRGGGLLCVWGYSFDVTIRIGRCYWDTTEDGKPLDVETLTTFTNPLYKDATALYVGWLGQWKAGNITELEKCDLVTISSMQPYREGTCAGWEFTVTVSAFLQ
jgi:hypothetical protein